MKKMRKMILGLLCVLLTSSFLLCGCSLKKTIVDVSEIMEINTIAIDETVTGKIAYMETQNIVDINHLISLYFQVDEESAEQYKWKNDMNLYETESRSLSITDPKYSTDGSVYFAYEDWTGGAVDCYTMLLDAISLQYEFFTAPKKWRMRYPEEELACCSLKQALETCHPYMEAIGYVEYQVTSYAVSLEQLEKQFSSKINNYGEIGAPDPSYVWVTYQEMEEARKSGDEELQQKLMEQKYSATKRGIPWSNEHEVYIFIYQPYISGGLVESSTQLAMIIYLPAWERPVYVSAVLPYTEGEVIAEADLISPQMILEEITLSNWLLSPDEIEISEMILVSSLTQENTSEGDHKQQVLKIPSWKITYRIPGHIENSGYETRYYNALDGTRLQ